MKKLFILLLLSGCAATGPIYHDNKPAVDSATIVIYRPDTFVMGGRDFSVEVNGVKCSLSNNEYATFEKFYGDVNVTATMWDSPGTTRQVIHTKPGYAYFVKISMNGTKLTTGVLGGIIGQALAEGMTSGPFDMNISNDMQNNPEIYSTHLSDCK